MSLGESGLGVRGRFPATPLTAGDGDFLANSLGLPLVSKALEPLPYACREAMRRLGFDPQCTAIVGDQICADIMAGRPAGRGCVLQPLRGTLRSRALLHHARGVEGSSYGASSQEIGILAKAIFSYGCVLPVS